MTLLARMIRAQLPSQGTIELAPSPTIGVIALDCDRSVRFLASSAGPSTAVGERVWVLEIDDSCHVTRMTGGGPPSAAVAAALADKVARDGQRDRALARIRAEREQLAGAQRALHATTPFAVVASQAPDVGSELAAFRKAFPRRKLAVRARSLTASDGASLGYVDFELVDDDWRELGRFGPSRWADPSFVTIGGADGDYLGIYLHPELLRRGAAPVVHASSDGDPPFTLVAASLAELRGGLAARRTPAQPISAVTRRWIDATNDGDVARTPDRRLVHQLLWGITPERQDDAAAHLERLYAANGHTFGRMRIAAQRQELVLADRARVLDEDENELLRFDRSRY